MSTYVNEFNNHIQAYFISSTYGNETLVTTSLNHLALVTDQRAFDVSVYSNNVFFINLHKLMSATGTKKMALMWSAVSVLEAASRCEETRRALVRNFHYLPPLTSMLQEVHNAEQQQRMLALVELLTHGAPVESSEPFVETLILKLLALMEQNLGGGQKGKNELVTLALSVLVNLCYRNLPVTYLLTKNITVSSFCGKIKHLGLVACKMYIVLERNDYMKQMDLHYLLKMSLKEVRNVLASKNSFILRHVVDYLHYIRQVSSDEQQTKENGRSAVAIEDNFFRQNLQEFLEGIEKHSGGKLNAVNEPTRKTRRKESEDKTIAEDVGNDGCMDILFEILECIVALEPVGVDFRRRIADIALNWIRGKQKCSRAVDLLRVILERGQTEDDPDKAVQEQLRVCRDVLHDLLAIVLNNTDEKLMISFSKILVTLAKIQNTPSSELDTVAEQFFQHLFSKIISENGQSFDYSLPDGQITVHLWALHTFNDLANISPTLWFAKVSNLLKQKPIQFIIARGLTSGDLELTEAMLHVTATVDFPRRDVSQMVSMLSSNKRPKAFSESQNQNNSSTNMTLAPLPSASLSRDVLERMNTTVSQIQDAVGAGHINDVTKVELIEFYNCKVSMQTQLMNDLSMNLNGMSSQIQTLLHQNHLLAAEIDKVQRKNLPLELKVSALETENRSLEKELSELKNATASYDKKISQMKLGLSDYIRKFSEKNQQCAELAKEVDAYRAREVSFEKETKRLQHELNDLTKTRDDSRRLLKAAEEDRQKLAEQLDNDKKLYDGKIRERERDISKRNDLIQQLETQLSLRDTKIESQERELRDALTQISAKDERISQIESELEEQASIQKAIQSLMNKGKK